MKDNIASIAEVELMGPLKGYKVVEIAGIGPAPITGMILADLGAEVILIERKSANANATIIDPTKMSKGAFFKRGKRSIALDLKQPEAIELVLALVEQSDMLIEGFRPGVMERLGLGPDECMKKNPKLVYGRMTGWGQTGPLAEYAGHDINYLSLSGALHYSGLDGDNPFPTCTMVGDVGAGSMHLALGLLAALLEVNVSGKGQVIDAAICDGSVYMMSLFATMRAQGVVSEQRGDDFLTGGAPWSQSYLCSDNRYITVQALEPNFYQELITLLGVSDDADFAKQHSKSHWHAAKLKMTALFFSKPQAHWQALLEQTNACFGTVLTLDEAPNHPHHQARNNFVEVDGFVQPAPAPKFSRTQQEVGSPPAFGEALDLLASRLNISADELKSYQDKGIL